MRSIVVWFMWFFGIRVLQLASKSLVIVMACATSVCGVSATIAAAAASRARKVELTLTVGMTMVFTVAMMVSMPALSGILGQDQLVGDAWIGGTVDSTGAVVTAGVLLGQSHVSAIHTVTKGLRGWWFALGFVAIGLESNFRQLASQLVGGKPIWLYLTGQTFNVLLTLAAAYLSFGGILFLTALFKHNQKIDRPSLFFRVYCFDVRPLRLRDRREIFKE